MNDNNLNNVENNVDNNVQNTVPNTMQNTVQNDVPTNVPNEVPTNVSNDVPNTPVNESINTIEEDLTPKSNKSKLILIVAILLLAGGAVLYFLNSKSGSSGNGGGEKQGTCLENIQFNGYMQMDDNLAVAYENTQYVFDSKFDLEFIEKAHNFDGITFNICYSDEKPSINFQVGDTTDSKTVLSFELYDSTAGKVLSAKNIEGLLSELGYHSYGKHSEQLKVVSVDYGTGFGFSDDVNYTYHDVELELSSGKVVTAQYKIPTGAEDKVSQLQENQTYTFDFEVIEDTFDPFLYVINDFS